MTLSAGLETIVAALNLPPDSRVDARIPKTLLTEQGAATPADRKAIASGIEEMWWIAALKPTTVAIPAFADKARDYAEIAVVTASLRPGAKSARIAELIHRAIPYPVLLIAGGEEGFTLSLAPKRAARNEGDKVVVEWITSTDPIVLDSPNAPTESFLASLSLSLQPSRDLSTVYEGWIGRCEALAAARLMGVFEAVDDGAFVEARRTALARHEALARSVAKLRAAAKREKQFVRRMDLNQRIKAIEAEMDAAKAIMSAASA